MKFSEGLDNTFFGTVETGAGVISVAYTGGAMACVGGIYAAVDGASKAAGGLSQMINCDNDKGETWNFKKNFYNYVSPEYGDKIYFADQMVGVAIGLYDIGEMAVSSGALKLPKPGMSRGSIIIPFYREVKSGNIVYRAINKMDRWRLDGGLGLEAKMPNGPWGLDEHITNGSSDIAWSKDPWISTTEDIQIAKKFYKKEQIGLVEIDLDKVPNLKTKGWEAYPDEGPFSAHGLSKTQKEISILNEIPLDAIRELTPEEIERIMSNGK